MKRHVNPETIHDCYICHQEFEQLLNLTEHVYMHEKGGNITCTHCQRDFTEPNRIRKHIGQIHEKETSDCNDCTGSSTGRDHLSAHVVKHEEAKDFKCEASGPEKADLERASKEPDPQVEGSCKRKKTHGDITPDKASDIKENEVKHKAPDETMMPGKEERIENAEALTLEDGIVQAGEGKKPLECNICGKRFTSNLTLEGHMKIHVSPETTHECYICDQECGQLLNLTEHVYMHEKGGNITCTYCQKDLTEKENTINISGRSMKRECFIALIVLRAPLG